MSCDTFLLAGKGVFYAVAFLGSLAAIFVWWSQHARLKIELLKEPSWNEDKLLVLIPVKVRNKSSASAQLDKASLKLDDGRISPHIESGQSGARSLGLGVGELQFHTSKMLAQTHLECVLVFKPTINKETHATICVIASSGAKKKVNVIIPAPPRAAS